MNGSGTITDPYLVATADDLNSIRNNLDSHYKQVSDIDISSYGSGEGWTPIGDISTPFTGSYDGNGYDISNLTINKPLADYVGLFGYISMSNTGYSFKNIKLLSVDVKGKNYTGGLAGYVYAIACINCFVSGNIEGSTSVGSLIGIYNVKAIGGHIRSCKAECRIIGQQYVGGICGYVRAYAGLSYIENCYSTGEIRGTSNVGGIAGYVLNASSGIYVTIRNCYASGDIYGISYVGGLVGRFSDSYSRILNSFALNKKIVRLSGTETTFGRCCGKPSGRNNNLYALETMEFIPYLME